MMFSRRPSAFLLLLVVVLCQTVMVKPSSGYHQDGKEAIEVGSHNLRHLAQMGERNLGGRRRRRRRMRNRRNMRLFVNGAIRNKVVVVEARRGTAGRVTRGYRGKGGKGYGGSSSKSSRSYHGGKGKGKGGRSGGTRYGVVTGDRSGKTRYAVDDDFFYEDDDWYVQTKPMRRRRSRSGVDGLDPGDGIVRGVVVVRPADRSPYRGTGIGRLNSFPRSESSRQRGNQFPNGLRPDMIRPDSSTGTETIPTAEGETTPAPDPDETTPDPPTDPDETTPDPPTDPDTDPAPPDVIIRSAFSLNYFPEDEERDLTPEEYEELRTLMNEFYSTAFQNDPAFADQFISYDTEFNSQVYTPGGDPTIAVDFDANFMFQDGFTVTPDEVLSKMESLDYQMFITDYLFRAPQNQLDSVQQVGFTASVMQVPAQ